MKPHLTLLAPAIIVASLWNPLQAKEHEVNARPGAESTRAGQFESSSALSVLAKGSDIIGVEVRNLQDERLGKIQDLVVDVGAGRIVGLMVNVGGVLNLGGNTATVPLASFTYDPQRKVLKLDSTQDALKASPRVEVSRWEEFRDPATVAEVYRHYRITPYFGEGTLTPGQSPRENTGNRASDETQSANRPSDDLTPIDQGNNDQDLETTARIRKDVMAHTTLSLSAKNVKIITVNGRVTLRGAVPTEAERDLIVQLAKSVAPGQVDDQLQVGSTETKERQ